MGTILIILIVLLIVVVISYNSLQQQSHKVKECASNVQVSISKKISLLNQLIDTVKNYQEGEQFTMLKISQDTNATNLMASYQQSGMVLSSIQGMAERFPNLKASDQYQSLMGNIRECELNIQAKRENYNSAVNRYNSHRSGIPTVFVAQIIGFSEAPYLEFDTAGTPDANILKNFKTDDGERLKQLFNKAGSGMAGAAKSISHHTGDVTKMLSEKLSTKNQPGFYYLIPGGVPKGPKPLDEIQKLLRDGIIPAETKIAKNGSDEWMEANEYHDDNSPLEEELN